MQTVIQPMLGYQIPVIVLQKDTPKEAVCLVFERVNTGGVALTVFELVTATYAASNFPLREDWSRRADHLKRYNIENTDFLQAVTLLATYAKRLDAERAESDSTTAIGCKRRDILRLSLEDYKRWADPVMEGFQRAFRLLQSQNIFAARDLPYRTQVVPLAAILTALGARGETDGVRTKLVRWYWCGVLGELYGGSVETRFAKDLPQVLRWIDGGPEPDTITDANFAPARLLSLRTRGSAAYKGLYALLMRDGCLDFRTGEPITAQTYYSDRIDVHHIFPQSWCAKRGIDVTHADSIVNKTALSAATNRAVGGNAPSVYLTRIEHAYDLTPDRLDTILRTHVIESDTLRRDDFDAFFVRRSRALLDRIGAAMGKHIADEIRPEDMAEAEQYVEPQEVA